MADIVKCPDCQGAKCTEISNGKYRCLYCGATFEVEKPKVEQPTPQPAQVAPQVIYVQQPIAPQSQVEQSIANKTGNRTKGTAALLAFFLGYFGAQYFYLGKTMLGVLCLIFCWTWIPCVVSVVDIIRFLCMSDKEFDLKYNVE